MNPLAWNLEIPQRMRTLPKIALGALPLGLMFASLVPFYFLQVSLQSILGIPDGLPVMDQPGGMLWSVLVLVSLVVLMIGGYLSGWVLNAIVLSVFLGWPQEKISRVLLYSELPPSWLEETHTATGDASSSATSAAWAVTRQMGKWRFIFQRGVLAWGIPMYLVMAALPVINGDVVATVSYLLRQACIWGAAGALFGFLIWYFSERSFSSRHGKQEP